MANLASPPPESVTEGRPLTPIEIDLQGNSSAMLLPELNRRIGPLLTDKQQLTYEPVPVEWESVDRIAHRLRLPPALIQAAAANLADTLASEMARTPLPDWHKARIDAFISKNYIEMSNGLPTKLSPMGRILLAPEALKKVRYSSVPVEEKTLVDGAMDEPSLGDSSGLAQTHEEMRAVIHRERQHQSRHRSLDWRDGLQLERDAVREEKDRLR